jgi:GMP synthase (glutamine-hydrolysing)
MQSDKKIAVIDFGGQYSHLIASRIRRLGAYSEIHSNEEPADSFRNYAGIILSGGPASVYEKDSPKLDPKVFQLGIPILGICYGHQLATLVLGGKVERAGTAEYGPADIELTTEAKARKFELLNQWSDKERVWMSHGDEVKELPSGFQVMGSTDSCKFAIVGDPDRCIYGIQFHPEVTHTQNGNQFLSNFIQICQVANTWSLEQFLAEETEKIKSQIGPGQKIFMLVSGGVDSTVAYLLLSKILGPQKVRGLLVDTGFMRKDEISHLNDNLHTLGIDLWIRDESENFYSALQGKSDPEEKRLIVGNLFLEAQARALTELALDPQHWILGQGTIYPDTIESGGTKHSQKIKTHHNRVPAIQKLMDSGKIIEPLKDLYKDEVRELGKKLGLPGEWTDRHPFPGPGLVVRMIASQKEVDLELENRIQSEFEKRYQNFQAKILPFPSVGVQGDQRSYANCILLNLFTKDWELFDKVSTEITNRFRAVNRVVFTNKTKLAEKYYFSPLSLNRRDSDLLREADDIVSKSIFEKNIQNEIWQMPVVLVPVGHEPGTFSVVLRPVESNEAMTANFYRMDWEILEQIVTLIRKIPKIGDVFYDLTNKPPGTIEWE